MKVKTYDKNIIHIIFPNPKEMGITLCRAQEFYESSNSKLHNCIFTYDEFVEEHTDKDGHFEYFENWHGYNIPSDVLTNFFDFFKLTNRESEIKKLVNNLKYKKYYLIGSLQGDKETLKHELLHAHYYLNNEYKQQVDMLVKSMDKDRKKQVTQVLKKMGYNKNVILDEINAYMSSSSYKYLKREIGFDIKKSDMNSFIDLSKTVMRD